MVLIGTEQVQQAALPYEDRPWEQKAFRVEDDYMAALNQKQIGLLAILELS